MSPQPTCADSPGAYRARTKVAVLAVAVLVGFSGGALQGADTVASAVAGAKVTIPFRPRASEDQLDRAPADFLSGTELNFTGPEKSLNDEQVQKLYAALAGPGAPTTLKGARIFRDLEYARAGDQSLTLDLYLPAQPAPPFPTIIYIHGGGWQRGDKNWCPALRQVQRGYAVVSISYLPAAPGPKLPVEVHHCKAAVRWLRAHAGQYYLDRDRFAVWGASAGGHLASLLGTSGGVDTLEGRVGEHRDQSSRVQAVCDWFGPSDLIALAERPREARTSSGGEPRGFSHLAGGPLDQPEVRAVLNQNSPVAHVTSDDPPFLIMHGDKDPAVPLTQSERLFDILSGAGVPATYVVVEGAGHGFAGSSDTGLNRIVDDFFDRVLRPPKD